ncbi:MAG: AMP-binding protein [Candidatus Tectomicrobia bacterium]|uniref:Phenylacetate-coenzyme A ligase n=1 Tax=Tectimicrobiota bacterium TaxID=2528274 RepID=A0A932LZF4_UNCTE|nr:AMP-binding protein [Candidatus Tectomicrobia bacterium]
MIGAQPPLSLPAPELMGAGNLACAGCGANLAMRLALKALGEKTIVLIPASCWAVFDGPYPFSSLRVPLLHVAFEAAASTAAGVRAGLAARGDDQTLVMAWAGDGGTFDIGLQALSAAAERNDDFLFVCYDNEAYMNTGIQRSSATPQQAWTTTTPLPTPKSQPKKNIMAIMAAHRIPYGATACVAYPEDLVEKFRTAREIRGFRFIHLLAPCPPGWKCDPSLTVTLGRLAVRSCYFPLYEVRAGKNYRITIQENQTPLQDYVAPQGRFQHLTSADIETLEREVQEEWQRLQSCASSQTPPSSIQFVPIRRKKTMYWEKEMECMPREELRTVQLRRLRDTVQRVSEKVPFYQAILKERGVQADDIRSLEDIKGLPFTLKDDFRKTYPFGLFAVPLKEIGRIHASSGTTGKPILGGYTRKDLDLWSDLMARTLTAGSVTHEDVVQNGYGYGLFTGGLGFHMGAERIGAVVIPMSASATDRQILFMQDLGPTVLTCTPSFALYLAETMEGMGIDPRKLKLRVGFFGAEPWTAEARRQIEEKLGLRAHDIYGLTEIIGPGVSVECEAQNGLHLNEDHFYPELINPDTLEPVGPGEPGELVLTTLTKEALSVLRYRTRDITTLNWSPCECGRTLVRMGKVLGRSDDMLIYRGANLYPSQVEGLLFAFAELEPIYLIVLSREKQRDELEIRVEAKPEIYRGGPTALMELAQRIQNKFRDFINLSPRISVVERGSIERSIGKAKRVMDLRAQ